MTTLYAGNPPFNSTDSEVPGLFGQDVSILAPDIAADCEPGCLPGGRPERDSPR